MNNDRYRKIFEDLARDLFAVAKRHGKRALREAVRDAANGNLIQEDSAPPDETEYPDGGVLVIPVSSNAEVATADEEKQDADEESADNDIPPDELDYPDEDVWTVPPEDEEEESDSGDEEKNADEEHELSDAAERVLDRLMDELKS